MKPFGNVGIFCDFDGTISESDMIAAIMMHFAPEEAKPLIADVVSRRITVKDGVEAMFRLLPSRRFEEIAEFARRQVKIRSGFANLVKFADESGMSLSVVSGGFDFFVEPAIKDYIRDHDVQVFCNHLDTSGEFLQVVWDYPCDDECEGGCGLCKPTVMRSFAPQVDVRIVVGDGVTDLKAARLADFVFARDKLLVLCAEMGLPHQGFDTFDDVVEGLRRGVFNTHN